MLIPGESSVRITDVARQPLLLVWPPAPNRVHLKPQEVHLFAAAISDFDSQVENLAALLAPEEARRARRFKFASDRDRFVIRRGLLRVVLGSHLGTAPQAIEFQQGEHGKPEVHTQGSSPLFFNTSHSGGVAVFAFTLMCPIGVDVECAGEISDMEALASRFFSAREAHSLAILPPDARLRAFYACWTRKEAYVKATGEGIAQALAKVEVSLAPSETPRIVSAQGDSHEEWQLQSFAPAQDYIGCLAYRNARLELSQWRLPVSIIKEKVY